MKTALVHISGLDTDPAGDCCGMRPFWEGVGELLDAPFTAIAWDDPKRRQKFVAAIQDADVAHMSGHSHGAAEAYDDLKALTPAKLLTVSLLDLAPPFDPNAWRGSEWLAPVVGLYTLDFYQRNDAPLAGVIVRGDEVYDVTGWGLHHSSMCADERVHARIKAAVYAQQIVRLRQFYSARASV